MRIGIIGLGTIGTAVVRGLAGQGHQICVSERSAENSAALNAAFSEVFVAPNQAVLDHSDVVFLGLMADHAGPVLEGLRFREGQKVVLLMAGAVLETVAALVVPATASAVMIPFPGIATGGSPVMALGDAALVETLFGDRNQVFAIKDEAELSAYLSAQAVLSPVARMVNDAAAWLGERVDDPEQGEAFLRMLVSSNLQDMTSAELIEALNTPGGYNQRLRLHMEDAGMGRVLKDGLDQLSS